MKKMPFETSKALNKIARKDADLAWACADDVVSQNEEEIVDNPQLYFEDGITLAMQAVQEGKAIFKVALTESKNPVCIRHLYYLGTEKEILKRFEGKYLWTRFGDAGEYENHGDDFSALADAMFEAGVKKLYGRTKTGVEANGYRDGEFISLFWGDKTGNFCRPISNRDYEILEGKLSLHVIGAKK